MQSAAVRGYMMDADLITFILNKCRRLRSLSAYLELTDKGLPLLAEPCFKIPK